MGKPYAISRSMTIDAPAKAVRAHIRDFRRWVDWSPWEGLDPDLQRTYSGKSAGAGSKYAWEGNKKAGAGTMQILRDEPDRVEVALEFSRPFQAQNTVEFLLTPVDDSTRVDWVMHGELNAFMRLFSLVKSMDSLMGPDLERGLTQLKQLAEAPTAS